YLCAGGWGDRPAALQRNTAATKAASVLRNLVDFMAIDQVLVVGSGKVFFQRDLDGFANVLVFNCTQNPQNLLNIGG
ncbi:hypothetical protein, partial [Thermoleptolyngbya sp. M55_K2018_002]|uniref:hypothetical protein n=1 Tax=Thermoleptolyngbya sp. M55_K2018_002 TaxID=2747808 RepID=UPI0025E0166E